MAISIQPQGLIKLMQTPLENDNLNQLTFSSVSNQSSYFDSKATIQFTDYTYIRKDNTIKVYAPIDTIINNNYLSYVNIGFSNKRYYAFITGMEYVNENTTLISFETDSYQTYMFDINIKSSFVVREHVNDDTIGLHTVPEQLETGDYITDKTVHGKSMSSFEVIVGATIDLALPKVNNKYQNVNGYQNAFTYSGLKYYSFYSATTLSNLLKDVADSGQSNGIVAIFMGNSDFFDTEEIEGKNYDVVKDNQTTKEKDFQYTIIESGQAIVVDVPNRPSSLDGYTPKNNKLLTYPYCYLLANNNGGESGVYKYELFDNQPNFKYIGCLSVGMSIKFIPLNYNKQNRNWLEGINCNKFPTCSWDNDVYTNWITQNAINIGANFASNFAQIAIGGMSDNPVAVSNGIIGVANEVGAIYQHYLMPPQVEGNINSGDVTFAGGMNRISLYCMNIKKEYAKIIDDYFQMYGYKVNSLKVPNITGRRNWNFVKTVNANIDGDVPQKDINKIKEMFNNGVTLWHNPSTIYDYSQNNDIV